MSTDVDSTVQHTEGPEPRNVAHGWKGGMSSKPATSSSFSSGRAGATTRTRRVMRRAMVVWSRAITQTSEREPAGEGGEREPSRVATPDPDVIRANIEKV